MKLDFEKEINKSLCEIETLHTGILNNLKHITAGNLSHTVCFAKYLTSEIGVECDRLRGKIGVAGKKKVKYIG